jgi:hypothetical protein
LLARSELTAELIPVSQTLSQVAAIGLQALEDLRNHRAADAGTREKNLQLLKAASKPQADVLDMIAPSVGLLVKAAGAQ